MSQIRLEQLEQRVVKLEKQVAQLQPLQRHVPGRDDWQRTIGMFQNNRIADDVNQEALRLREAERERARHGGFQ